MSGGCSLLIPFPPALVRVREWLSQDFSVFVLGHWCSHGSSALFSSRQSRFALQLRHLFCILSSRAACTLLFLRALHALPSFLLAKGIAPPERKVLRAEWNLPENALLFRVRRMGVGVGPGPNLNATVGRAERTRTPRRRRERYDSSGKGLGVGRQTRGCVLPSRSWRGLLLAETVRRGPSLSGEILGSGGGGSTQGSRG